MNKCTHCGYVFSDEDRQIETETHGLDAGPYESYSVCPMCGHDYEPAAQCDLCGEFFLDEEMHNGVCDKCITESINYETFLGFLKSTDGELERFCFDYFYGIEPPEETNETLRGDLLEKLEQEAFIPNKILNDKILKYVMDDSDTTELFAEYLKEVRG